MGHDLRRKGGEGGREGELERERNRKDRRKNAVGGWLPEGLLQLTLTNPSSAISCLLGYLILADGFNLYFEGQPNTPPPSLSRQDLGQILLQEERHSRVIFTCNYLSN